MKRILIIIGILLSLLDARAFDVRAVYVDHRTQVMTMPALKAFAKKAADGGMNAIIMEWEASFPFRENATLCNQYAFSVEEVKDFVAYCSSIGIDVIPLQNCFGHAEYILRHERYAVLREDNRDFSQVCPLKVQQAEPVFRSIFAEIAALHPSKYLHIGCDETVLLGRDKKCAAYIEENGRSKLFVGYVARMCAIAKELGKTPVIWADILLQYPEAAAELPEDVVIVDWNYGWKANHFGDLDALIAQGFTMWGASSMRSSPDNIYLTDWPKHFANLRNYVPFCREKGFAGMVQTSWSTSGTYGYVRDHGNTIDIQPIREVYPVSAFDVLLQAFFEALATEAPLADDFVRRYAAGHFGFGEDGCSLLEDFFAMEQKPVTGRGVKQEDLSAAISEVEAMGKRLHSARPRKARSEFKHYVLMMDIRLNYLKYRKVQLCFEAPGFGCEGRPALAAELKPLIREAKKLDRRFRRLNASTLKDPSVQLGKYSYVQQMKYLYATCR